MHSVYHVRDGTFTKPPVPGVRGWNGRKQGVEYAEMTLPLAQVGPLWRAVRRRSPKAWFPKTKDRHTPRLRLWANWGVDGQPGLIVTGWPQGPPESETGSENDFGAECGEENPPAEGGPAVVPPDAAAAAHAPALDNDRAADAAAGAEALAAAAVADDIATTPPAAAPALPLAGGVGGAPPAYSGSSEWYDPWPAGTVQSIRDLRSWLSEVEGRTVMADAVIHLSRRCVAEGYGVAGHEESTCTMCELPLQVHKVRPHA